MKLTYELLVQHNACVPQRDEFRRLFPDGCEPTIDTLLYLSSCEYEPCRTLDPWWLYNVLPDEGPGSKRAYALWCAEQVAYLNTDPRVTECLRVVRRRVEDPTGTSDGDLAAAWAAAGAATWAAAGAATWAAAGAAAGAATWAAAGAAAWAAAGAATWAAAWAATWAAAGAAAGDAAGGAAGGEFMDVALVCLSQLLIEAP